MENFLIVLHFLWIPTAIALGFRIAKKHRAQTGKFIGLGCLWSLLIYAGGFITLIVIGLATCKLDFR